jgi:NADH-quinone oxidoreductase subunit L
MFVGRRGLASWASTALRPLERCCEAKWGFDLAYDWLISRLVLGSDRLLWRIVDDRVIDGAVNRTASLVGGVAGVWRRSQTGLVRTYILAMLVGAVLIIGWLTWP